MSVYHLAIPYTYHGVWGLFSRPPPPPTPSFFASEFYEAIQYFSNARLFTQSIKDQVFISFICVSIHFSHGKAFFSILGQLGLLVCIDIRALVYRRVYIVINVLALLIMRVLVFVCNSET